MKIKWMRVNCILTVVYAIETAIMAVLYTAGILPSSAVEIIFGIATMIHCVLFGYVTCLQDHSDGAEEIDQW